MLEAVQRRIQRTLLDLQRVAGQLLDTQQDSVAVQRSERDGLQDEEVERALQEFD
jgi:protein involved in polysaccharide export with SLBB domain